METDKQFVEMIVKEIVEKPDEVKVERSVDEMGVLITLWVAPSDMGKVIGKDGRTAKAIRTLLRVLGAKNNARVTLKIAEPEGGSYVPEDNGAPAAERSEAPIAEETPAPAEEKPEDEQPTSII